MLSALHWDCLREILGTDAMLHELTPVRTSAWCTLGGCIDGVAPAAEHRLIERIARDRIGRVFLNGSNLGRLARAVKRAHPAVEILTVFHNVEARFFLGAFRNRPSARALGVLIANFIAERMAVRHSDRRIVLNRRDGAGLRRLYRRGETDVLPMALADQPRSDHSADTNGYLLFVGGGFYANRDGIRWFAKYVAPRIARPTMVVGRGLDDLRSAIEPNVTLIGAVDDLGPWYRGAAAVIAPIFDGSGMKTKVAEALLHGKRVFGTTEAFAGYEDIVDQAGPRCETADAFVAAIDALDTATPPPYDPALRALYERLYSRDAARDTLAATLARR